MKFYIVKIVLIDLLLIEFSPMLIFFLVFRYTDFLFNRGLGGI